MKKSTAALAVLAAAALPAQAAVILSSNFDAHTSTDGATQFDGVNWTANGVSTPSSTVPLTQATGANKTAKVQLSGAAANADRLAVDYNIDTVANHAPFWFDVAFTAQSAGITVTDATFDYQFISGGGANQFGTHPGSGVVTVSILDNNLATLTSATVGPLGTSDAASNTGTGIVVDFSDLALNNGENYTLRFSVTSEATAGNNIAIDNLSLNGTAVPEPSAAILGALGLLALLRRRR